MKRYMLLAALLMAGCAGPTVVKPLAPGLDDAATYRKKTEVRMVGCQEIKGKYPRTISIVETTRDGIRFELSGCYGDKGEVFQIIH